MTTAHQQSLFSRIINRSDRISLLSELLSQEDLLLFKHSQTPSDNQHLLICFVFRRLWKSLEDEEPTITLFMCRYETHPDLGEPERRVQSLLFFPLLSRHLSLLRFFIMFYLHVRPKESYTQEMLVIVSSSPQMWASLFISSKHS